MLAYIPAPWIRHGCGTTDCGVLSTGTCWLPHQDRWLLDPDRAPAQNHWNYENHIRSPNHSMNLRWNLWFPRSDTSHGMVYQSCLFFFDMFATPRIQHGQHIQHRMASPAESLTGSSEKMSSKISWLPLNFFVSNCFNSGMMWHVFLRFSEYPVVRASKGIDFDELDRMLDVLEAMVGVWEATDCKCPAPALRPYIYIYTYYHHKTTIGPQEDSAL